jgi:hypothetical protein
VSWKDGLAAIFHIIRFRFKDWFRDKEIGNNYESI